MSWYENDGKNYDDIPIPEELSVRVQEAIDISNARRLEKMKAAKLRRRKTIGRSLASAAAVMLTFTAMLNTSTTFAESVNKVPVIREIGRVLTFKVYEEETDNSNISVEVPGIQMIEADTNGLADSINKEIHDRCQQYADEAVARAEAYHKAFLETGGTPEEWAAHNIEIKVWYDVKSQSEKYLSFVVGGSESWSSANNETRYYNIDLQTEKPVTLKDLLGEDYIRIANESILAQMETKELPDGIQFWAPEKGGFVSVNDETKFYINEAGNPVIVFDKYEIAPGAAGEIEFEIPMKDTAEETVSEADTSAVDSEAESDESAAGEIYEDNFAVDASAAAEFAKEIKTVMAAGDLAGLADLASYPLYIGFPDAGVSVTSKEEFLDLKEERIFTAEMQESIAAADETRLSPSMAGFSLAKEGKPNVVFGAVDGKLAVQGINY